MPKHLTVRVEVPEAARTLSVMASVMVAWTRGRFAAPEDMDALPPHWQALVRDVEALLAPKDRPASEGDRAE